MRRRCSLWFFAACFAALVAAPSAALARPSVALTKIEVRAGDDAPRLQHELKQLLTSAVRRTSFGPGGPKTKLLVSARLVDWSEEERDGVLRIRCTMSGRIAGSRGAKSKISFGGSPKDRLKLEKQVLKMVADGLVSRLSAIARADAIAAKAKERGDQ